MSIESRESLNNKAWKICQKLRGSMDGYEMKNYIFAMIFYRYISESFTEWFNKPEHDAGNKSFDYTNWSDSDALKWKSDAVSKKGYFILPSQLFENLFKKIDTEKDEKFRTELNVILSGIFRSIEDSAKGAESRDDIKGLLTGVDWDDSRLGAEVTERSKRIKEVMEGVKEMTINTAGNSEKDFLGDLYEYLMSMYASSSGKKGGEFYTPSEVSELLTKIAVEGKTYVKNAYDPTCGSGSLLLKFKKVLGDKNFQELCGQEKNMTTYNLCRMNMFMHNINYSKFDIKHGDTLETPKHSLDKRFEAIVANPPHSVEWDSGQIKFLSDPRFEPVGELPPKKHGDFAFILHSLYHLSTTGKAAIIVSIGCLTRSGKEANIRRWLIEQDYIETVILLPSDLFFGTSISAAILVLRKNKTDNNQVLFINASNEYIKTKSEKKLSPENIKSIVELYKKRKNIDFLSAVVSREEISKNNYDLGVNVYVKQPDTREKIDIVALNKEIDETVTRINTLRANINQIIKNIHKDKI